MTVPGRKVTSGAYCKKCDQHWKDAESLEGNHTSSFCPACGSKIDQHRMFRPTWDMTAQFARDEKQ